MAVKSLRGVISALLDIVDSIKSLSIKTSGIISRSHLSADQTIPTGFTKITIDSIDFGTNFNTSNYRFVSSGYGFFFINSLLRFQTSGSVAGDIMATIYINGTIFVRGQRLNLTPTVWGGVQHILASGLVYLEPGDYVEVYAYNNFASSLLISKDSYLEVISLSGLPDTVISSTQGHGEMYQNDNVIVTTINTINVWEEINNYSAGELLNVSFLNSDLTIENGSGLFQIDCTISGFPAGINQIMEFAISVNDTIITKIKQKHKFASVTDSNEVSLTGLYNFSTSDIIKVEVRNLSSTSNFTVENSNLTIHRIK